jgi:uncharacterized membrane-anchored protein
MQITSMNTTAITGFQETRNTETWPTGCLLRKPVERGGLNRGTIGSSALLAAILVIFIVYTTIKHKDVATSTEAERV